MPESKQAARPIGSTAAGTFEGRPRCGPFRLRRRPGTVTRPPSARRVRPGRPPARRRRGGSCRAARWRPCPPGGRRCPGRLEEAASCSGSACSCCCSVLAVPRLPVVLGRGGRANKRLDKPAPRRRWPGRQHPRIAAGDAGDGIRRPRQHGSTARADSILLMRTDPGKHLISMLSVPRDLRVPIPGHGSTKINAAFAYGGSPLLIRTINDLPASRSTTWCWSTSAASSELIDSMGGVTIDNARDQVVAAVRRQGWCFKQGTITPERPECAGLLADPPHDQPGGLRHHPHRAPAAGDAGDRAPAGLADEHASPAHRSATPSRSRWPPTCRPTSCWRWAGSSSGRSRTVECHLGGTPQLIGGQDVLVAQRAQPGRDQRLPRPNSAASAAGRVALRPGLHDQVAVSAAASCGGRARAAGRAPRGSARRPARRTSAARRPA